MIDSKIATSLTFFKIMLTFQICHNNILKLYLYVVYIDLYKVSNIQKKKKICIRIVILLFSELWKICLAMTFLFILIMLFAVMAFASNVVLSAECSFCRNASTMLAT